jgi:hypothetical protein
MGGRAIVSERAMIEFCALRSAPRAVEKLPVHAQELREDEPDETDAD